MAYVASPGWNAHSQCMAPTRHPVSSGVTTGESDLLAQRRGRSARRRGPGQQVSEAVPATSGRTLVLSTQLQRYAHLGVQLDDQRHDAELRTAGSASERRTTGNGLESSILRCGAGGDRQSGAPRRRRSLMLEPFIDCAKGSRRCRWLSDAGTRPRDRRGAAGAAGPHALVRRQLDVRLTARTVECWPRPAALPATSVPRGASHHRDRAHAREAPPDGRMDPGPLHR